MSPTSARDHAHDCDVNSPTRAAMGCDPLAKCAMRLDERLAAGLFVPGALEIAQLGLERGERRQVDSYARQFRPCISNL